MKVAILGGGFGLYGYLPALLQIPDVEVLLPLRYKEQLKARADISNFCDVVSWISDDESLLKSCEAIVIALAPKQQHVLVKKCLALNNIKYFFLEKPLSFSPDSACELLMELKSSGKKFRIGYNFRYTNWGQNLLKNPQNISAIFWNFRAHHYVNNVSTWKKLHEEGGGALRFYGIHLVALLSEIGYDEVIYSSIETQHQGEAENWRAELIGSNLQACKINIASNSNETNFTINSAVETSTFLQPFQTERDEENHIMDQRISFLKHGLEDLFFEEQLYYDWYDKVNCLWKNIEKVNHIL